MKVRITLIVEVDPEARRAEYGEPSLTLTEIREDVKASIVGVVQQATYPEDSGIIKSVRESYRSRNA